MIFGHFRCSNLPGRRPRIPVNSSAASARCVPADLWRCAVDIHSMLPRLRGARLTLLALAPTVALACTSSADCGLLGDCATSRKCVCDQGWTSPNCSVLDLAPARWGAERQAYEVNRSSWGGNVIQDPVTKLYHLFFSEMRVGGLHTFDQPGHCQLTTAAASSPLGPFNMQRTVLRSSATGAISHNVQPQVGGDGAIYIFMITTYPNPGARVDTSGGCPGCPLSIIVGRAPKLGAEFEWVTPRLLDTNGTAILKDNPSAIVYANGTVLMVTRGTSLFTATSWRGPYQMLRSSLIPNEDAPKSKFYNNISTRTEGAPPVSASMAIRWCGFEKW